jgi:hypothetical protein
MDPDLGSDNFRVVLCGRNQTGESAGKHLNDASLKFRATGTFSMCCREGAA